MDRQSLIGLTHYKNKDDILVIEAHTAQKANEHIAEILGKFSDFKTALFLSGGGTPKKLYEHFVAEKSLKAGTVLQVDERFGAKSHKNSNELMIANTGLIKYFEDLNIRFYPMLENEKDLETAARDYDEALRFIFKYFPKSVGILGIGEDGHTAGIPAIPAVSRKMIEDQSSLISFYEAEKYGARITMNLHGLAMLDLIIILVLGQEKREIINAMFKGESENKDIEAFPAKFYRRAEIAKKVILITDQIV